MKIELSYAFAFDFSFPNTYQRNIWMKNFCFEIVDHFYNDILLDKMESIFWTTPLIIPKEGEMKSFQNLL